MNNLFDIELAAPGVARWWDESIVPTLSDYIRIPNKSPLFDPEWEAHGHMRRAAELLHYGRRVWLLTR